MPKEKLVPTLTLVQVTSKGSQPVALELVVEGAQADPELLRGCACGGHRCGPRPARSPCARPLLRSANGIRWLKRRDGAPIGRGRPRWNRPGSRLAPARWRAPGRCPGTVDRSTTDGQRWARVKPGRPSSRPIRCSNTSAKGSRSSRRSLSGGKRTGKTARRW